MRVPGPFFGIIIVVLLVISSGCIGDLQSKAGVGNFGAAPAPTRAGPEVTGPAGSECMKVCTQYSGQDQTQCTRACCVADCSETSPGGAESCTNRCLGIPVYGTQQGAFAPATGTSSGAAPAGFTCEFDQSLLDASAEYRTWFNTSCHYNDFCGWWESNDLLPKPTPTVECINCSFDTWLSVQPPTPVPTPCPARTPKPGTSVPPVTTTTTTGLSSGACATGLTQCRVFSTDYCVDLMTDVKHCGACRKGCLLAHAENGCSGGVCFIQQCEKGWADCNGIPSDGCEVDLNADDNNCGTCGRVCSLPKAGYAVCNGVNENGKCEVQYCVTGWLNSNGIHEDGCESPSN